MLRRLFLLSLAALIASGCSQGDDAASEETTVDIGRRHHLPFFIEHDDLGSPKMEVNTHAT